MIELVNSKIYVQTKYEKAIKWKGDIPEKKLNIYAKKYTEVHWYIFLCYSKTIV